jgi:hypothetical protein
VQRLLGVIVLAVSGSVVAFGCPSAMGCQAPEIGAAQAGSALALVSAGLFAIRGRRKKQ